MEQVLQVIGYHGNYQLMVTEDMRRVEIRHNGRVIRAVNARGINLVDYAHTVVSLGQFIAPAVVVDNWRLMHFNSRRYQQPGNNPLYYVARRLYGYSIPTYAPRYAPGWFDTNYHNPGYSIDNLINTGHYRYNGRDTGIHAFITI